MAERFLLDQHGNRISTVEYNPARPEDGMLWRAEQECDAIVASCERDADRTQDSRTMRHAGRIPLEVVNRAMREGWFDDPAAWRKWANDSDNRRFRTWQGTV